MSTSDRSGLGKAAEGLKDSLLGMAKKFAGQLSEDAELELEGREQAEKGNALRRAGQHEVRANIEDFRAGNSHDRMTDHAEA